MKKATVLLRMPEMKSLTGLKEDLVLATFAEHFSSVNKNFRFVFQNDCGLKLSETLALARQYISGRAKIVRGMCQNV